MKDVWISVCMSEGKCARPPMGSEKRLGPSPPPPPTTKPNQNSGPGHSNYRHEAWTSRPGSGQYGTVPGPTSHPHQGLRTSFPRIKAIPRSIWPQRRHSAKLFLQPPELGLPHPQASVPPPFGSGAVEELGESQFRRGDIHCGTLYK